MEQIYVPQPLLRVSLTVTSIHREGFSLRTCSDLHASISFINRVFYPAGISVYLKDCRTVPYMKDSHPEGENNERSFHRVSLMDLSADINVFIVPYIEDNDGTLAYTRFLGNERYIVIGEMVYDGDGVYTRFQSGRFSNMFAHEIGHALDLDHVLARGSLMYPSQLKDGDPAVGSEESLSSSEIDIMRGYLRGKRG
jgi:hypothetical protein